MPGRTPGWGDRDRAPEARKQISNQNRRNKT